MYLAKIVYSVIYQIDETFIVVGDRKAMHAEHSLRTTRFSSLGILSDLLSANVQIACCICHTRVLYIVSQTYRITS